MLYWWRPVKLEFHTITINKHLQFSTHTHAVCQHTTFILIKDVHFRNGASFTPRISGLSVKTSSGLFRAISLSLLSCSLASFFDAGVFNNGQTYNLAIRNLHKIVSKKQFTIMFMCMFLVLSVYNIFIWKFGSKIQLTRL